jgi:hypothetical protein
MVTTEPMGRPGCGGRCNLGMIRRRGRKWIGEGGQHRGQNPGKSHRRKDKAEHGLVSSAGKIDAAKLDERVHHVGDAGHRNR